jgi:replicative DNA helicase
MIIIDYADLMAFETQYSDLRHNLAAVYTKLREMAMLRHLSVITASQSNRASYGARLVGLQHFAEDIQKAMIADLILSLCQTENEALQNKMRIFICKNRTGKKGVQIENLYSYEIGQFSLSSQIYVDRRGGDEEEDADRNKETT